MNKNTKYWYNMFSKIDSILGIQYQPIMKIDILYSLIFRQYQINIGKLISAGHKISMLLQHWHWIDYWISKWYWITNISAILLDNEEQYSPTIINLILMQYFFPWLIQYCKYNISPIMEIDIVIVNISPISNRYW